MKLFIYSVLGLIAPSLASNSTLQACIYAAAPNTTALTQVHTANSSTLPGHPFDVVIAKQSGYAFTSLTAVNHTFTLGVLNTSNFPPTLVHGITLNDTRLKVNEGVFGMALTEDGNYLFVSAGMGAFVVNATSAIAGDASPVVGILDGGRNVTGDSAIQITLTHDGSYAFVSQEYPGSIDVFAMDYTNAREGSVTSIHLGYVNLGGAVVGSELSPDEKLLYVTSETNPTLETSAGPESKIDCGILSVLNVSVLVTDPNIAQIANVSAGYNPVRGIVSSDGEYVWVSARASNHLLAFNASALLADPANALVATVQVGTLPVGLTFVNDEKYIITADSARFNASAGEHTGLTVVDVQAALSGNGSASAVLGYIPTGLFPREFATTSDNKTLLVTDFMSNLVQAIDLTTLP